MRTFITTQPTIPNTRARAQALTLIALGGVCALLALTLHPGDELGLLALGLGLLVAHLVNRARFFIAGVLVTLFALVNVSFSLGVIQANALYGLYLLAAAFGVGIATLAARRGYVGPNPISPAVIVGVIGLLLLGTTNATLTNTGFYGYFVSLWMPALALTLTGLALLVSVWSQNA